MIGALIIWLLIRLFSDSKPRSGYQAYMRSPEWRSRRAAALSFYGARCSRCWATERLDVHHRTYRNFGHEPLMDLEILCRPCHRRVHGRYF